MIIDVHAHLSPPESARRYPMPPSLTDVDAMLDARSEAGIDLTVIGSPVGAGAMMRVPGVDNYRQPADRLRALHDWTAALVARFPERLRAYAYVNPLGSEAELRAADETVRDPAFVGFVINSSVRGRFLDDPAADGFFALAAERRLPVFVHPPAEPAGARDVADLRFVEQVSRFADVASGLAMIAFAGWPDRYPDLALIGATGGGGVAALTDKLDLAARPRPFGLPGGAEAPAVSASPGAAIRRMYVDTAAPSDALTAMNLAVFGAGHMLLGTDSPPVPVPPARAVARIRDLPIGPAEQAAILGGNAASLFGLAPVRTGGRT
ncbi:amidohydrolase family protein [Actinomadura napierensis]|uniref:Amidohydrolase family protein n=1 Tax=Actinomadura napierensis TaxID=267854 RepID=A0ABN2ZY46_9ACTN